VIDDEPAVGHILRRLLEDEGHEVYVADDGSRGFAAASRQRPDVVLLDLMMPIMDGYSVLEAFRRDERTASIPIVMLSAIQTESAKQRCLQLGAASYLAKPFEPEDVIRVLGSVLAVARS
jgi:two-component system phosphate regulon response regulator PhoB